MGRGGGGKGGGGGRRGGWKGNSAGHRAAALKGAARRRTRQKGFNRLMEKQTIIEGKARRGAISKRGLKRKLNIMSQAMERMRFGNKAGIPKRGGRKMLKGYTGNKLTSIKWIKDQG